MKNITSDSLTAMRKFADLADMLKFAQLHDWGNKAYLSDVTSALHLYDYCQKEMVAFYDMQSLKAWAGY
jgi:hypothetical protein